MPNNPSRLEELEEKLTAAGDSLAAWWLAEVIKGYEAGYCSDGDQAECPYPTGSGRGFAWEEGRQMGVDDWIPF